MYISEFGLYNNSIALKEVFEILTKNKIKRCSMYTLNTKKIID